MFYSFFSYAFKKVNLPCELCRLYKLCRLYELCKDLKLILQKRKRLRQNT